MRYTWRRGAKYCGLARLPDRFELRCNGRHIAMAQRSRGDLWFWYSLHPDHFMNTSDTPLPLDEVKKQVVQFFRDREPTPSAGGQLGGRDEGK